MQHSKSVGGALAVLMFAMACDIADVTEPEAPPAVATVVVTAPRLTMTVGEQMPLAASPKSADGAPLDRAVAWRSEDATRAGVTPGGVVVAIAAGTVDIVATSGGREGRVTLTLLAPEPEPEPEPEPVTVLEILGATADLEEGESVWLRAVARTASGAIVQRPVTWHSTEPAVATVHVAEPQVGRVQALGRGVSRIIAAIGSVEASVALRVSSRPTQDLLYASDRGAQSGIMLLPLIPGGTPVPLPAGTWPRDPSPSPEGTRIVFAATVVDAAGRPNDVLQVMDRSGGNRRVLVDLPGMESNPSWSPEGTRILFHATDAASEQTDVWVVHADGTGPRNLTAGLPADVTDKRHAAWSPDGNRIAFIAVRNGEHRVWTMRSDGTGAAPLTTDPGFDQSPTWSPTGDRIAFVRYDHVAFETGWDVMIVSAHGGTPVRLALPGDQLAPAWSSDGEFIAVSGTAVAGRGPHEIHTLRPDGTGLRVRTVDPAWGGGLVPTWIVRP